MASEKWRGPPMRGQFKEKINTVETGFQPIANCTAKTHLLPLETFSAALYIAESFYINDLIGTS